VAVPAAVPPDGETVIHVGSLTDAAHEPPMHALGLAFTLKFVEPPAAATTGTEEGLAENIQVATVGVAPA
jgi:hypothetical protein